MTKLCIDCKHCVHTGPRIITLVNGEHCIDSYVCTHGKPFISQCYIKRSSISECGPDGKLWEPKD